MLLLLTTYNKKEAFGSIVNVILHDYRTILQIYEAILEAEISLVEGVGLGKGNYTEMSKFTINVSG